MKRFRFVVIAFLILCISLPSAWAQNTSTQGKEFWLSFMHNGFKDHDLGGWVINQVLISAKRDCSGTISNPLTGWTTDFNVSANSITTVEIPENQGYHATNIYETIAQKGIKVQADDTISVFCTNIAYVSFDASFVLPVESLGDEYIIQSYDQSRDGSTNAYVYNNETSAFLIVATEDNTVIEITPSVATLGGRPANETFSITMNAGETYHLRSVRYGSERDLSGTHILAADCKRIAVFNGNTVTCIPIDMGNGYDHVFEQAMPLRSWGKKFVVTSSRNRNRDFIKITSSANDNVVTKNGNPLVTLRAGDSYTFDMNETEGSCFLEATQPCAVYLYNNSSYDQSWLGGLGDPSMVWIAPVEQRINDVTFSTFDHPNINIETHSVNIIVNAEDIANVYFDEQQVSPLLFARVNGTDDYKFTRMDITHGVHRITCANGFNAHVYGFGDAKGYAYLVGSNAINLSSSLTLNDEPVLPNESYTYCAHQPITFKVDVNLPNYELLWDFGDGTTSNENPVVHTYENGSIYNVSLAITTDEGGCTGSSSNTTNFIVDARQQYIIESDEVCAGVLYNGHGFNNVHINNDTILARLQDNPIHGECQDSVLVYITAHQNYHIPINDSRCWQGEPGVYDAHGFSFVFDQPGTYDHQLSLQTIEGCDSILNLHLTVADQITYEFDHHECGNSYLWDGQTYSASGDYERYYTSAGGCDSIVTLHLTMGIPQHTSFDTITCGVFEWNGILYDHSDTYQQTFTTIDGCDSIVTCHLLLSGNMEGTTINIDTCNSYRWLGTEYTESGPYVKTLSSSLGCDSTVYLNLRLDYTPTPSEIYPIDTSNHAPHWVVTATEFQINSYEFGIREEGHPGQCNWPNPIEWHFVKKTNINEWIEDQNVQWILEPDSTTNPPGKKVRLYVLNFIEDTIWLAATVKNDCTEDNLGNNPGVSKHYWFVCSFYGIDEGDPSTSSTGSGASNFEVVPNPNNGQMTLNFVNMTGKIDIKVYDMRGVLIDNTQTYNSSGNTTSFTYDFKPNARGLYLFIANSKESTLMKKVIIFP